MRKTAVIAMSLCVSLHATTDRLVCLTIDQVDTGHPKHPNQATLVNNHTESFYVYHRKEACFDLSEQYYMQYFLWETENSIVYGTRCYYQPDAKHAGKVLRYDGQSGSTPCSIVDH